MNITRRGALQGLGVAFGISAALPWRQTGAAEPQRLDVNDPAAIALGYVENAAQVDLKKYPGVCARLKLR